MLNLLLAMSLVVAFTLPSSGQKANLDAKLQEVVQEFDALPMRKRQAYISHKRQAYSAIENKKFFTCLIEVSIAQTIFKNDLDLLLIKGLCYAEIQHIDQAIEQYNLILAINPNHWQALENMVEINYFDHRYIEAIKYIKKLNVIVANQVGKTEFLPLLDFKHLIALTKLAEKKPSKYKDEIAKLRKKYSYMHDTPFYYFANALESLSYGDKDLAMNWIVKAYLIFERNDIIGVWNKALVDTDYIEAHEIILRTNQPE